MITVSFTNNHDTLAMRVRGHAGAAEAGQDIICASASILCYTVAQAAQFMEAQGKMRKKPKIRLDEGDAVVAMYPNTDAYAEVLHTFFVAQIGYDLLAQNYPQYVDIRHRLVGH